MQRLANGVQMDLTAHPPPFLSLINNRGCSHRDVTETNQPCDSLPMKLGTRSGVMIVIIRCRMADRAFENLEGEVVQTGDAVTLHLNNIHDHSD